MSLTSVNVPASLRESKRDRLDLIWNYALRIKGWGQVQGPSDDRQLFASSPFCTGEHRCYTEHHQKHSDDDKNLREWAFIGSSSFGSLGSVSLTLAFLFDVEDSLSRRIGGYT